MADPVLGGLAELRQRLRKTIRDKEWIVPEAVGPRLDQGDVTFTASGEKAGFERDVDWGQCQDTTETGGTMGMRSFGEEAEKFGVVRAIRGIAREAELGRGESGGLYAGSSVEGIDLEAGIIREHEPGGRTGGDLCRQLVEEPASQRFGLEPGVGFERDAGLIDGWRAREIPQRLIGEPVAQDRPDFGDLVGVAGCDDQSGHHFQGTRKEAKTPCAV